MKIQVGGYDVMLWFLILCESLLLTFLRASSGAVPVSQKKFELGLSHKRHSSQDDGQIVMC